MLDAYIIDRMKRERQERETQEIRVPLYVPVPEPQTDSGRDKVPEDRRGSCEISVLV